MFNAHFITSVGDQITMMFLNKGMLLTGTCFYLENPVFGAVSKQNMLLFNQEVLLLATIRYRIQAVGYNGACTVIMINSCHETSKV